MLGADDDRAGFVPAHPLLRELSARHPGVRVGRSGRVLEALVPAVLEQKVVGAEARRAWRYLLLKFGDPAPGPAPAGMRVSPPPRTWRRIPSWEWHRAGVEGVRARTIIGAAEVAGRLEEIVTMPPADADRRLRSLAGIGVWTSAEVRQRACGDADAVSVGDYHLPSRVGWALAGRRGWTTPGCSSCSRRTPATGTGPPGWWSWPGSARPGAAPGCPSATTARSDPSPLRPADPPRPRPSARACRPISPSPAAPQPKPRPSLPTTPLPRAPHQPPQSRDAVRDQLIGVAITTPDRLITNRRSGWAGRRGAAGVGWERPAGAGRTAGRGGRGSRAGGWAGARRHAARLGAGRGIAGPEAAGGTT